MKYPIFFFLLLFSFSISATGQTNPSARSTPDPEAEQRRKDAAVAFLRETMIDVANMRTLENRISFTSELAALLWYHDDKEARQLFGSAVNDFKALLQQYDMQMNAVGMPSENERSYGPMFGEASDRAKVYRKFRTAMGVRQQIALSIAEHEPELAYNFFYDSMNVLTNQEFRKQMESNDANFETQLLAAIAKTNATRAMDLARKSVEKGFLQQHVELLKQIYDKSPEKGVEFAGILLSKLKSTKASEVSAWPVRSLIDFGESTIKSESSDGKKKAIYTRAELRDLAEILAMSLLEGESEYASPLSHVETIQRYSPGRAAQVKAKFQDRKTNGGTGSDYEVAGVGGPPPPPPPRARPSGERSGTVEAGPVEKTEEEKLLEQVAGISKSGLPKDERDRIVAKSRDIIAKTEGRGKKIMALGMLAAQVRKAGDTQLATDIMRDASALVSTNPKNYQDFMYTWMLISAYSQADPDKAYPTIEETILRLNDLISAFVRIGEFVDVAEEMIVDGEVQVGAFGGGMLRGISGQMNIADSVLMTLAVHDFDKLKNVTNRFDRTELRVMAKMMVLRTVFGKKPEKNLDAAAMELSEEGF
ncbi:MAG: hypothetical protein QUS14_07345 [Pyrinomonadaceae bacterium]|nr:hypothetical protein [Pyrinomonadaceae bacterium]